MYYLGGICVDKIKQNYIKNEIKRLGFIAILFAICLCVLGLNPEVKHSYLLYFVAFVVAVLVFGIVRSVFLYHNEINKLNDIDIYTLEKEYNTEHQVYKVNQGEMHLLLSYIVSWDRGFIHFIPIHKIEKAIFYITKHKIEWVIPVGTSIMLKFYMQNGEKINVDLTFHKKEKEKISEWIDEKLGNNNLK